MKLVNGCEMIHFRIFKIEFRLRGYFMQRKSGVSIQSSNTGRVLKCIANGQAMTRAAIAKRLNLSKPTVSAIVKELLDEDWIYETGSGSASIDGGRRPVELAFHAKRYYIIGIDIGGTNVMIGLTDLAGTICAYREFPTRQHLHSDLFEEMKRCIDSMKSQLVIQDSDILGIGVGVPGVTDVEKGLVIEAPAVDWRRFPVKQELNAIFDFPIFVDNDVNSIVLGEHWKGISTTHKNLIYIAIGTGIGSGIILNGELYRGSNYSAGEIGYVVTDKEHAKRYQPVFEGYGYLESVAGGSSISRELSNRIGKNVTAKEAFELYQAGDVDAVAVIDFAMENLGVGLANYVSLFDPELIILGGGVSQSFSLISEKLGQMIATYAPRDCEVVQTSLGKEAGVIGAAALFLKEYGLLLD